jgi:hypothetical protein
MPVPGTPGELDRQSLMMVVSVHVQHGNHDSSTALHTS